MRVRRIRMVTVDGDKLNKAIYDKAMSLSELSRLSGVSRDSIYRMLCGKECKFITLLKLAFALNTDADKLVK